MFTASKSRSGLSQAVAVLLACCLPAQVLADEFDYLPDDVRVIASINVTTGAKTKTFQEFMKLTTSGPFSSEDDAKAQEASVKNFTTKISRMMLGVGMSNGEKAAEIEIATALKPLNIDEAKNLKKSTESRFRKNITFKEIKHGFTTIYQQTYQTQFGKDDKFSDPIEGDAFFLAEGKYLVGSRKVDALKKIIDRNKATPTRSAAVEAGLKEAGNTNIISVVIDIENLPADARADMHKSFSAIPGYADYKDSLDKAKLFVIKGNEPKGKFSLSATLTCNDKAGAAAIKSGADKALAFIQLKVNEKTQFEKQPDDPKGKDNPPNPFGDVAKYLDAVRTAVKAIRLSSAGTKVTASIEIEPEIAVNTMMGWFFVAGNFVEPRPAPKGKEPPIDPKK